MVKTGWRFYNHLKNEVVGFCLASQKGCKKKNKVKKHIKTTNQLKGCLQNLLGMLSFDSTKWSEVVKQSWLHPQEVAAS